MNATDDEYWNEKSFEGFSFEDEEKDLNSTIKKIPPECEGIQIGSTKTKLENIESLDTILPKEILDKIFIKRSSEINKTCTTQEKQKKCEIYYRKYCYVMYIYIRVISEFRRKNNAVTRSFVH